MATSVAALRQVLEAERVDDYPAAIDSAQKALDAIGAYPGGIDSLRDALDRCAEQDKLRLRELINKASVDHKVNGELIRIAMQKNAALRATVAQQSAEATYSDRGHVPSVLGSLLSRKV
ncbi:MAG: hypothetical protein FGM22_09395 [Burkholderiaceae bacterium]|jgi:hypothetical protein|nr:hypothetical protein [Burkholderiaceae bacterium]